MSGSSIQEEDTEEAVWEGHEREEELKWEWEGALGWQADEQHGCCLR